MFSRKQPTKPVDHKVYDCVELVHFFLSTTPGRYLGTLIVNPKCYYHWAKVFLRSKINQTDLPPFTENSQSHCLPTLTLPSSQYCFAWCPMALVNHCPFRTLSLQFWLGSGVTIETDSREMSVSVFGQSRLATGFCNSL